jgi:hypothetical protein
MVFMQDMLKPTAHLPEIEIAPGDAIVRQGDSAGAVCRGVGADANLTPMRRRLTDPASQAVIPKPATIQPSTRWVS